jgi:hypothetical protein
VQTIQTIQTIQTLQTIQSVQTNELQRQLFKPIENENTDNIPKMNLIRQPEKNYFDRMNYDSSFKRKFSSVGFTPSKNDTLYNEPRSKKFMSVNHEEKNKN